jgi:hypothetical protein
VIVARVGTPFVRGGGIERLLALVLPVVAALVLKVEHDCGTELALVSVCVAAVWLCRGGRDRVFYIATCLLVVAFPIVAVTLLSQQGGIVGDSDSRLYHDVSRLIAARVPLTVQINPLLFEYVREAGLECGHIVAAPGYFKFVGFVYTLAESIGLEGAWVAVVVNIVAVAGTAEVVNRAARALGVRKRSSVIASTGLVLYPVTLHAAFGVRKDALIMSVWSSLWYLAIFERSRKWVVVSLAMALIPLRMAFAVLTVAWIVVFQVRERRRGDIRGAWGVKVGLMACAGWLAIQVLRLPFGGAVYLVNPESDYYEVLRGNSEGVTGVLLNSAPGRVIYTLFFPFPALRVPGVGELYTSVMLLLGCGATLGTCIGVLLYRGTWSRYLRAVVWGFVVFVTMMAVIVRRAVDEGMIGVLEPRYKLPVVVLSVLVSLVWLEKISTRRAFARSACRCRLARHGVHLCPPAA